MTNTPRLLTRLLAALPLTAALLLSTACTSTTEASAAPLSDIADEVWWTMPCTDQGQPATCYDPHAFTDHTNLPPIALYVITYGEVSDQMWDELRALGYHGDPTDTAERLYVPLEVAAGHCVTDTECEETRRFLAEADALHI
jgi:hypothetical protein